MAEEFQSDLALVVKNICEHKNISIGASFLADQSAQDQNLPRDMVVKPAEMLVDSFLDMTNPVKETNIFQTYAFKAHRQAKSHYELLPEFINQRKKENGGQEVKMPTNEEEQELLKFAKSKNWLTEDAIKEKL